MVELKEPSFHPSPKDGTSDSTSFTDRKDPVETEKSDDKEEREITGLMTLSRQEERGSSMEVGFGFVRGTDKSRRKHRIKAQVQVAV